MKRVAPQSLVLALALLAPLAFSPACRDPERRALESLSQADRHALYEKSIASFRALCVRPLPEGLESRCSEEATFLRAFPECDEGCRLETTSWVPGPTR